MVNSLDIKILHIERGVMMQPMDIQGRSRLAAERFELLRDDAGSSSAPIRHLRLRLGSLLVGAGLRLAPDAGRDRNGPGTVVGHSVGVIGTRR
jgi:hypothetical protein